MSGATRTDTAIARQVAGDLESRSPVQSRWMRLLADEVDRLRILPTECANCHMPLRGTAVCGECDAGALSRMRIAERQLRKAGR